MKPFMVATAMTLYAAAVIAAMFTGVTFATQYNSAWPMAPMGVLVFGGFWFWVYKMAKLHE